MADIPVPKLVFENQSSGMVIPTSPSKPVTHNLPTEFTGNLVTLPVTPPQKAQVSPLMADMPASLIIPPATVALPKRRRRRRKK